MRKIVVGEFVSLDGVMESPEKWTFQYYSDEVQQVIAASMMNSDAMLLGRVTYEGFEASFSSQSGGLADVMNNQAKYVVSTTFKKAGWNNSKLINKNIVEEIAKLKQQPGKDISVTGSGTLVQTLLENDLIDEYSLLVYPVVLGSGKHLFRETNKTSMKLVFTKALDTGVVALTYQTAREAAQTPGDTAQAARKA